MPLRQRLARRPQAIGAGLWKPVERVEAFTVKGYAIGDAFAAMLVIGAAAVSPIEKAAGDIRRVQLAGLLVFELVDTAAAATVAQGFPLAAVESLERLLPKR